MNTNSFFEALNMTKAYAYVRVSKDEDRQGDSIELQERVVLQYCEENDIELVDTIRDNNVSGYNFKTRQGLQELISLCENGLCNTVVAKDISRLGRHQAYLLLLIDFFRENGIRLLLLNENYDSEKDNDDMVGIKAWFSEMYIKDISAKTKRQLKTIQKEDGLVALPPYGFVKKKTGEGETLFEIDSTMGPIVVRIFNMYVQGNGLKKIASTLTGEGVPAPQIAIAKAHGIYSPNKKYGSVWHTNVIRNILKNEAYYGLLINRKSVRHTINKRRGNLVPVDDRYYHDNFYPAIISRAMFDSVQALMASRRSSNFRAGSLGPHLFTGILKCAECGQNLVFKNRSKTGGSYVCSTYHKLGANHCTTHTVRESLLIDIIMGELTKMVENARINYQLIDQEIAKRENRFKNYSSTLANLEAKKSKIEDAMDETMTARSEGLVSDKLSKRIVEKKNQEYEQVEVQIEEIKKMKSESVIRIQDLTKSVQILEMVVESKMLSRTAVELLISQITVSQDKIKQHSGKRYPVDINIEWKAPFLYNEGIVAS